MNILKKYIIECLMEHPYSDINKDPHTDEKIKNAKDIAKKIIDSERKKLLSSKYRLHGNRIGRLETAFKQASEEYKKRTRDL